MKRISVIAVLLGAAMLLLILLRSPNANAPQFKRLRTPLSLQPSHHIGYDFLSPRPFDGGKMWIYSASNNSNIGALLYDIEDRKVLGQLTNAWPVTMIDRSNLLCVGSVSGWKLKERLVSLVARISLGRIKPPLPPPEAQRYWVLDLEKNYALRMGELPRRPNSTFQPSPDLRYGCTHLHGMGLEDDIYVFDFKERSIKKLDVHGWPSGWWDDRNILVFTTNNDFILRDVRTEKTSPFLGSERIAAFLRDNMISENPAMTRAYCIWSGRQNDFYLTDTRQRWLADESFLVKVERPDGKLKLLAHRFKFEWSDHFDPTGRYYLYSGREAGAASDGVFLRDTHSGTNRTLVQPAGDRYFSIPRFYGDSIIYLRSNMLWKISLDGTKNVQLFPP